MTGGSAGSITAAMVGRILLHDAGQRGILHEAWVERADVDTMMAQPSPSALFSHALQEELGQEYVKGSERFPLNDGNPSSCAPKKLHFSFSLANMVGIDYGLKYASTNTVVTADNVFPSTFFSDKFKETVVAGQSTDAAQWRRIAAAGIASGSFPVAFPPYFVARKAGDFPGSLPPVVGQTTILPGDHAVSDGGMFDNEPVREAVMLSREQDGGVLSPCRIFLLVDPNLNSSKQNADFFRPEAAPGSFLGNGLFANVKRLGEMALAEAEAKDWLRVGRVNTQLAWRDAFVSQLGATMQVLPDDSVAGLKTEIDAQVETIVAKKRELARDSGRDFDPNYLKTRLLRVAAHHADQIEAITAAPADLRQQLFVRNVFVLNNIAVLDSKRPMNLFAIGAKGEQTAGDALFALAGFFEQTWREHDYRLGRRNAHRLLPEFLAVPDYDREGGATGHNRQYDPEPNWPDMGAITMADAPDGKRRKFIDLVVADADRVLASEPINMNGFYRFFARWKIRSIVEKKLGL